MKDFHEQLEILKEKLANQTQETYVINQGQVEKIRLMLIHMKIRWKKSGRNVSLFYKQNFKRLEEEIRLQVCTI